MTETIQKTQIEQIQDTASSPSVEMRRDPGIGGGEKLMEAIDSMADDMSVDGFKCAHPECGLTHSHPTNKHRAGDSFDMSHEDAASMEANPVCHCGLNQMAHEGVEDAPTPSKANDMAPIPDSMARHIEEQA